MKINDRKGTENYVVDHLSKIVREKDHVPLKEDFSDEHLIQVSIIIPWFADIVNYLVTSQFPPNMSSS